jgi:hypothetical protein
VMRICIIAESGNAVRVLEKLVSSLHVIKAIRACRLVGVNVKEPSSGQKNKLLLLPRLHA